MTLPIGRTAPRPPSPPPAPKTAPPEKVKVAPADAYGYGPLGEEMQPQVRDRHLEAMREAQRSPDFWKLDPSVQKSVLDVLASNAPATADKAHVVLDALKRTSGLSPEQQKLLVQGVARGRFNPTLAASLTKLAGSPGFRSLKDSEKTAVLSQARHYANTSSVGNLERLIGKPWFQSQSLSDKQRSLKVIAYMSEPGRGDRVILNNTLEHLVGPKATMHLEWKHNLGMNRWGNAAEGGAIELEAGVVRADNERQVNDFLVNNIVPHEVNHQLSDYEPGTTFDFLEDEYRGWYVGFKAQNGRAPTRAEVAGYFDHAYLGRGTELYGSKVWGMRGDKAQEAQFFEMMSKALGTKVDASNWFDVLPGYAKADAKLRNAPAPPPSGNVDNR